MGVIGRFGEQADIFNTGQLYKGKHGLHVAVFRARIHLKIDSFLCTIEHGITNFIGQFGGIEPLLRTYTLPSRVTDIRIASSRRALGRYRALAAVARSITTILWAWRLLMSPRNIATKAKKIAATGAGSIRQYSSLRRLADLGKPLRRNPMLVF